jgi:hypothetical protein
LFSKTLGFVRQPISEWGLVFYPVTFLHGKTPSTEVKVFLHHVPSWEQKPAGFQDQVGNPEV